MNLAVQKPNPATCQTPGADLPRNDLDRRRALGQFFTSAPVAEFVWDLLEVILGRRFPSNTNVVDPACGEGVFLRVAHDRGALSAKNLFGVDIDETLECSWRNEPMLREANLFVGNGLLDKPSTGIAEGAFNVVIGNPPFSGDGLTGLLRLLEAAPDGVQHQEQDLFAPSVLKEEVESSDEPLSRPEREQLEDLVRVLSLYACWRLETEPEAEEPEVKSESAPAELFAVGALFDRRRPTPSDYQQAAQLIAHWPRDRQLDTSRPEIRDTIRRLASTAIEVVFTERFLRLAKRGGLIAVIVPESIVASDRLGAFRMWLLGRMDLLASVSLPQKVFTGVGANAKTSIIFARRRAHDRPDGWYSADAADTPDEDRPIFLAAPRLDAPGFTVESYLARVLADARKEREHFWRQAKRP